MISAFDNGLMTFEEGDSEEEDEDLSRDVLPFALALSDANRDEEITKTSSSSSVLLLSVISAVRLARLFLCCVCGVCVLVRWRGGFDRCDEWTWRRR